MIIARHVGMWLIVAAILYGVVRWGYTPATVVACVGAVLFAISEADEIWNARP